MRELFHSALERDPAARSVYLDQACAGDADLRREVDSLIAAHGHVGSFIAEPAGTPERMSSQSFPHVPLPFGLQIGPYEVIELLGAGGMGEVYRARDPRLGRHVALKLLPPDLATDPGRRERFLREARLVSALNHSNICTIHEIGSADGLDYICFEYIEGQTLASLLEGPALSCERLLELSLPLAEAIAYAHGKGILHRDLKPSNIMITDRGPKVLDFGLAKTLVAREATEATTSLSDSGVIMGTVAYMSPEQALGRKVDDRSDVFSFGSVLYEMATGRRAFSGETPAEILDVLLHREPAALEDLRPDLPADLSLVLKKTLRKDASERYLHMADLIADLRRLHAGRAALIGRRHRMVRAGILAGLGAAVAMGLVLLNRWQAIPPAPSPNSLAVMYFENLSDPSDADNLGRMLAGLVTTDLAASDGLQVVSSQRLVDIARQLGKAEAAADKTVATEVARRAGAARMVLGQVVRAGSRVVATAELVEVDDGRRLGSYRVEGTSAQDVFSMAEGLGSLLRLKAGGREPQQGAVPLSRQLTTSVDAYGAYLRGETLMQHWKSREAADAFQEAVRLDPDFALAQYRLGIALSLWGSLGPEGRAAVERAAVLKDRLPRRERAVLDGAVLVYAGRLSDAVPVLEAVLAHDPDNKELLYLLSECYMHSPREANPRRAAEVIERLLVLDPGFRLVYHQLAVACAMLGDFEKARAKLDGWEAGEPESVRTIRGHLSFLEGRPEEALQLTEPPSPGLPTIWHSTYAMAAGRWDVVRGIIQEQARAAASRQAATGKRPAQYGRLWGQARLHLYLGELGQAEATFEEALPLFRLQPNEGPVAGIDVLHNLAELRALKRDYRGALAHAEKALLIQPDGPYCLYVAGVFALRAGDAAAAERHLSRLVSVAAVAHGPLVPHYRDALTAEVALARGRPLEAQPLLESAVRSGKLRYEHWAGFATGPRFLDGLARTYLALGEREKAAGVLDELVSHRNDLVPAPVTFIRALYTLGKLKLDLGDRRAGAELLQRFLGYWGKADWDLPEVREARARLAATIPASPRTAMSGGPGTP